MKVERESKTGKEKKKITETKQKCQNKRILIMVVKILPRTKMTSNKTVEHLIEFVKKV